MAENLFTSIIYNSVPKVSRSYIWGQQNLTWIQFVLSPSTESLGSTPRLAFSSNRKLDHVAHCPLIDHSNCVTTSYNHGYYRVQNPWLQSTSTKIYFFVSMTTFLISPKQDILSETQKSSWRHSVLQIILKARSIPVDFDSDIKHRNVKIKIQRVNYILKSIDEKITTVKII